MQTFYFFTATLSPDGNLHTSEFPSAVREADTPLEACEQVLSSYVDKWPNAVIGPTNRVVTLNPGENNLMSFVIGKFPR